MGSDHSWPSGGPRMSVFRAQKPSLTTSVIGICWEANSGSFPTLGTTQGSHAGTPGPQQKLRNRRGRGGCSSCS